MTKVDPMAHVLELAENMGGSLSVPRHRVVLCLFERLIARKEAVHHAT